MSTHDWILVLTGALLIGLAKGGLPGVGNLTVILFASVFEPKASVGILLPVLIAADVVAVTVYRRHVEWSYLKILMPWMVIGVIVGWLSFGYMSNEGVKRFIGGTVLAMTLLQIWRYWLSQRKNSEALSERIPHSIYFRGSLGLIGGFATMVANAAGPVGQLYFLSVGLPKMAFIGTGAWCFFLINVFKLPFQAELGILSFDSMRISFLLAPMAIVGALIAPKIVRFVPQKIFSIVVWVFIIFAGVKMLFL